MIRKWIGFGLVTLAVSATGFILSGSIAGAVNSGADPGGKNPTSTAKIQDAGIGEYQRALAEARKDLLDKEMQNLRLLKQNEKLKKLVQSKAGRRVWKLSQLCIENLESGVPVEAETRKKLSKIVSIKIDKMPLIQALDKFAQIADINLAADCYHLYHAGKMNSSIDIYETPISFEASGPAEIVLREMIQKACSLTTDEPLWIAVRNDVVIVSNCRDSKEGKTAYLAVYDVSDLLRDYTLPHTDVNMPATLYQIPEAYGLYGNNSFVSYGANIWGDPSTMVASRFDMIFMQQTPKDRRKVLLKQLTNYALADNKEATLFKRMHIYNGKLFAKLTDIEHERLRTTIKLMRKTLPKPVTVKTWMVKLSKSQLEKLGNKINQRDIELPVDKLLKLDTIDFNIIRGRMGQSLSCRSGNVQNIGHSSDPIASTNQIAYFDRLTKIFTGQAYWVSVNPCPEKPNRIMFKCYAANIKKNDISRLKKSNISSINCNETAIVIDTDLPLGKPVIAGAVTSKAGDPFYLVVMITKD